MTDRIEPYTMTPSCTCRSCGAPIRFEQTEDGRGVPLDVAPVAGGAIDLVRDGPCRRHLVSVQPEVGVVRWQAHVCPDESERELQASRQSERGRDRLNAARDRREGRSRWRPMP